MKIPETSANIGAYYGNEENGQWQPNGVIVESGGAVGGGDARPIYPVHVPRNHIPGYVMAGAYYGGGVAYSAPPPDDFADYMWMEHEEEFDKQVMQQLEEEALMEQCIEAMLEDEQRERQRPTNGHSPHYPTTSNGGSLSLEETVSRSTLNPLAAEFVPTFRVPPLDNTDEKAESPPEVSKEVPSSTDESHPESDTHTPDSKTEEPQEPTETPEVSAADDKRREKRVEKKTEKKTSKSDVRKNKPQQSRSDSKVQAPSQPLKKKDIIKSTKSSPSLSDTNDEPVPTLVPTPAVVPAPPVAPAPLNTPIPTLPEEKDLGPKPINYAAAAKANKPKKPVITTSTIQTTIQTTIATTITEKTPPPTEKPKKEKPILKPERPMQRKNSAK